jgi:hypothetical protein
MAEYDAPIIANFIDAEFKASLNPDIAGVQDRVR